MAEFKRTGCGTFVIIAVVLAALGFGGWWFYVHYLVGPRHARIQEFAILQTGHLDMTLLFKDALPSGDPKDVKLVFRSESLSAGEFTLTWDELAPGCRSGNTMLKPAEPPPLGVPIVARLIVRQHFEQLMQGGVANWSNFKVTATLLWGGTQQDRASTTVLFNYQSAGT
jgi:hypothetical protein